MIITEITALGSQVYLVDDLTSGRREVFKVQLRSFDWNGSCTCRTFTEVCAHMLCHARKKERQRCDHILAAQAFAIENEFPALAERADQNIIKLNDYENHVDGTAGF